MAQIKIYYVNLAGYPGCTFTYGFEFYSKEGKSILTVGEFCGSRKVVDVGEDEQVVGIKAQTPTHMNHGSLYNLQFQIAKQF